jgi:hypothetical protein
VHGIIKLEEVQVLGLHFLYCFLGSSVKGLSRNKQGRICRGFFALDKASKRGNTGGISAFG